MSADYRPYLDWIDSQHEAMVKTLVALAEINSGSLNLDGLARMTAQLCSILKPLGGTIEEIPLAPFPRITLDGQKEEVSLGRALRMVKGPEVSIKVLLCGHMDTVFPEGSSFSRTTLLNQNTLKGPGVSDLKGGLLVMITALKALERSPWAGELGWEILINPDEELGSPGSAPLLVQSARRNQVGLVFEPALPDGSLVSTRKGSGNFTVVAHGRTAHAGRETDLGRNAIKALSDFIQAINTNALDREGVTVNPGVIHGGLAENIVPDLALLRFNIRTARLEDEPWLLEKINETIDRISRVDGLDLELHGAFHRHPKLLTDGNQQMLNMITLCGREIGIPLSWQPTGGCCDGNNLSAAGLPNIDNLGVRGDNLHTHEEIVFLDSLTERAKLSALFLMKLASGEMTWSRLP